MPVMVISLTVRVPKLVPAMPEPVLSPMSRPRIGVAGAEGDRVGGSGGGGEGRPGAAGRRAGVALNGARVIPLIAVMRGAGALADQQLAVPQRHALGVRRRCRCRRRSVCPVCGFGAAPVLTAWNAASVENGVEQPAAVGGQRGAGRGGVVDEPDHVADGDGDVAGRGAAAVGEPVEEVVRAGEPGRRVVGEGAVGVQHDVAAARRRGRAGRRRTPAPRWCSSAPQWVIVAPNSVSSVPRCSTPSATVLTLMPTLPVAV